MGSRRKYYDGAGNRFPNQGQTLITHQPDVWINEGTMKIMAAQPLEFSNRYEVEPFKPGSDHSTWRSFNPDLDTLTGRYIIVEDSIISPWQSENGRYWGTEFLVQVSPVEYRAGDTLLMETSSCPPGRCN